MKLPTWAWVGMAVLLVFGLYHYNRARTFKKQLDAASTPAPAPAPAEGEGN